MKLKIMLILLLFFAVFSPFCFAEGQIHLLTDKNVLEKEEQMTLKVQLQDVKIAAYTIEIYFDTTKLEFVKGPENTNYANSRILSTWVSPNGQNEKNIEIGEFVLKAIEEGNTNITVLGEFYGENGERFPIDAASLEISIGKLQTIEQENNIESVLPEETTKSSTNLRVLRLNQEGMSPSFQKENKEYYFIADSTVSALEVTALPENPNATVTITGQDSLQMGKNVITIHVIAADKTKEEEYKIYVTKTTEKEKANTNLETLAIEEAILSPEFHNLRTKYQAEIPYETEKVTVLAIPQKEKAKVTIQQNEKMEIGNNRIQIEVLAEDGITTKKYEILVYRRNQEEQAQYEEETKVQAEKLATLIEEQQVNPKKGKTKEEQKQNRKWWRCYASFCSSWNSNSWNKNQK